VNPITYPLLTIMPIFALCAIVQNSEGLIAGTDDGATATRPHPLMYEGDSESGQFSARLGPDGIENFGVVCYHRFAPCDTGS